MDAVQNTIICGIFGAFLAWLAVIQLPDITWEVFLGFCFRAAISVVAFI